MATKLHRLFAPLATCLLLSALAGTLKAADDQPASEDQKKSDELIYKTLMKLHDQGADLYDRREYSACYRLFQGALTMTQLQMEHNPDLKKSIEKGLQTVESRDSNLSDSAKAMVLHKVIFEIRAKFKPPAKKAEEKNKEEEKKTEIKKGDKADDKKPEEKNKEGEKKKDDKKPDEKKSDDKKKDESEKESD